MLLKKLYKVRRTFGVLWLSRTHNQSCAIVCKYYSHPIECNLYKSMCLKMLRDATAICENTHFSFRYIPREGVIKNK